MSAWIALAVFLILGATLCGSVAFILASEGRAKSGLFTVALSMIWAPPPTARRH